MCAIGSVKEWYQGMSPQIEKMSVTAACLGLAGYNCRFVNKEHKYPAHWITSLKKEHHIGSNGQSHESNLST